jgi:L-fuconolactonase
MSVIDAHQHFWTTSRSDYGWLTPELGIIYQDFLPDGLRPLLTAADIDRTILVQAAATEAETLYLLEMAERTPFVAGVIGWVDLEAENAAERVEAMADKGVIGLRPMVQDIDDTQWLLRPALRPAIQTMIAKDLRFDALIQPRHLNVLSDFMATYPALRVVIDHAAKPDIASGVLQPWADNIAKLAAETNAYCKISGLVTEAGPDWQPGDIEPVVSHLLKVFGPERLIWGSDWPVLNLASDYAGWHNLTNNLLGNLSEDEQALIKGGNVARFYGVPQ